MALRSGALRHRITLQKQSESTDAIGQPIVSWTNVVAVMASIEPSTGRMLVRAQEMSLNRPTTITMRWHPSLSDQQALGGMRVAFSGRVWNIVSVENELERNRTLTLIADEGVTDA